MAGIGPHLVFDGFGCPAGPLEDLQALELLLEGLPGRVHVTRLLPPHVIRHGVPGPNAGLSGFVLIAGGHVSVHTFPKRKFVTVDVFASADFDVEDALRELTAAFRPKRVDWKLLDRGLEYPRHLGDNRQRVESDRRAVVARAMGLGVSR